MEIREEKIELQEKPCRKICAKDIASLASYVIFFVAFRLIAPFRLLRFYVKKFIPENGDGLFKPFLPTQCLRLCIILSSNKLEYLSFFDKIGL